MYQMKRFIDMKRSPLSMFCLYQVGLCSVSLSANSWPRMRIHLFGCNHFGVSEKFCSVVKNADCLVRQQDL